jgi:plastocyanin
MFRFQQPARPSVRGGSALVGGVALAALLLAGCGPAASTIELAAASFVQTTATINAGQALQFDDPASTGGPHMLCLGQNQVCDASATGPTALQGGGFRIMAGSPTIAVVFATPGTYDITCSLHPLMNLVVTVR